MFKVFCSGWDEEMQAGSPSKGERIASRREDFIYDLLELAAETFEPAVEALGPGVTMGFTSDVEGTDWDPL